MRDRLIFTGQLLFTLVVAAFLVVPAMLSISAGVTVNYFRGISSGVTLQWVFQVWDLYAGTILLSFVIAFATLAVTLIAGVPSAYALYIRGGRLSRIIEEIITLPLAITGLAIALGLLLLILTPIARIVFSIFGYLLEKDYLYVSITLFVLAVILWNF